ncbi:MAG: flagellar hook-basal body complex protein FliE [Bacillota bacterium]|nr:flagellar hook-basal body complex protein FliE [Bacillota bacterium]
MEVRPTVGWPLQGVGGAPGAAAQRGKEQGASFADLLKSALAEVNRLQQEAEEASLRLATGEAELHQVMIAAEKANISLQLTLAIRNKLLDAYHEIMRMQV